MSQIFLRSQKDEKNQSFEQFKIITIKKKQLKLIFCIVLVAILIWFIGGWMQPFKNQIVHFFKNWFLTPNPLQGWVQIQPTMFI